MKFDVVVRFQVLTAANMKMPALWDNAQCSLVKQTDISECLLPPLSG
jgi:hypothetical protein